MSILSGSEVRGDLDAESEAWRRREARDAECVSVSESLATTWFVQQALFKHSSTVWGLVEILVKQLR
jgi:hypothetical protein